MTEEAGQVKKRDTAQRFLLLGLMGLTVFTVQQEIKLFLDDLSFGRLETEVSFWGRGEYRPTESTIQRTGLAIESLLDGRPGHPDYLSIKANRSAWLAYWAESGEQQRYYSSQSVSAQLSALESRPAHLPDWRALADYAVRVEGYEDALNQAEARLGTP